MNRRVVLAIAGLILVTAAAFMTAQVFGPNRKATAPEVETPEVELTTEEVETEVIELLFPGEGNLLYSEPREMPAVGTIDQRIQAVIETLLAGPTSAGFRPPLPDGVKVLAVHFLEREGTVVLDLGAPEEEGPLAMGSRREMLSAYSLVNTVTSNFEGAERLQLLWNGRQPVTFAGHLDTSRPLAPNSSLQASPAP